MLPIKDENPSYRRPWVNYTLITINILVFFYELSLGRELNRFIFRYGVIPVEIIHGRGWLTIFTSMFLHGGWMHIFGNMLYLWIFGDNVEDSIGHFKYLIFYLISGVAAALTQVLVNPTSHIPLIGASGAISGVLGAYFVLYPRARVLTLIPDPFTLGLFLRIVRIPAFFVLGFWFIIQFMYGLASLPYMGRTGGVAFFAHIGGFVFGMIAIKFFNPRKHYHYWYWNRF